MKILHLEDSPPDAELVGEVLQAELPGAEVVVVSTRERFVSELQTAPAPALILADFHLPTFTGMEALGLARERLQAVPFIFLSGSIGEELAIAAVRAGAYDYVLKDNPGRLPLVLRRALKESAEGRRRQEGEHRIFELVGVIERAAEAIVVSDANHRVTLWNRGAAALYGIPSEEAVGCVADELFPAGIRTRLAAARAAVVATGAWRGELAFTTRDGRNLVIELHATAVADAAGAASAQLIIATDITEKKRLEEHLLLAQRIESLGLLAAGIAHDLNNVLAPVLIITPLLRRRAGPDETRVIDILEASAKRGAGLVRQILGFARGSSGEFRPLQLRQMVADVAQIGRATFPRSIVIEVQVASDLRSVLGDPTQIHQVLLNLAVNARDAMLPAGGALTLRAANHELDPTAASQLEGGRPGAYVRLEVADTGTGMSPEIVARIWEPFFTTKGIGQGTGLGLATVRGIVVRHGGFIALETRPGAGSQFSVYFPVAEAPSPATLADGAGALSRGRGELVLVVDDESAVRETAIAILEQYGYRTIGCADGLEAATLYPLRNEEIHLILTDLDMPKLNGADLAAALRRIRPGARILAMSGIGSRDPLGAVDPSLFDAKLSKPFAPEELLAAVGSALRGP